MMTDRFFAMDADGNMERFDTADAAKAWAQTALEYEQDRAGDGWSEDVTWICWGEIKQQVVMTKSTPTPGGQFDSIDEYELEDVKP